MTSPPSRGVLLRALVRRDLIALSRDRLWMFLAPAALLFFIIAARVIPGSGVLDVTVGVCPGWPAAFAGDAVPGLELVPFDDPEALEKAVLGEPPDGGPSLAAGILLPSGFPELPGEGAAPIHVRVLLAEGLPAGLRCALSSAVREGLSAFVTAAAGRDPLSSLPVTLPSLDSLLPEGGALPAGLPLNQLLRPLMVVALLFMESLALAGLVSVEVEQRTASAVLVTPVRTGDLLGAKLLTGTLLAGLQASIFLLATGLPGDEFPVLAVLLLLGALMASATGMIAGASGKGFTGTLFLGMLLLIPLMAPAVALLTPGSAPPVLRAMPSYGLVLGLDAALGGSTPAASGIPALLAWDAALLATALLLLRRRMASL